MPHIWRDSGKVAVEAAELVPRFWSSRNVLSMEISRNRNKPYGVKALQRGGGKDMKLIIDFDTLPNRIQQELGDPRKVEHNLLYWYKTDQNAVNFYTNFIRPDGMHLNPEEQQRYITNASVLISILCLRQKHTAERIKTGMSLKGLVKFLSDECNSFNPILERKFNIQHNLPTHPTRFKEALEGFENEFKSDGQSWPFNFQSIIKDVEGKRKNNARIVDDRTEMVLNGLFATQKHKPTALEIHRSYEAFLAGYAEVYNEDSGEIFNPKEFKSLSESTVRNYLTKWENRAATFKTRSGDRQKYKGQFDPYHQLERPKYAGSLISIDDRNPPFKDLDGNRIWFYNGIDLGSEVFTTFVYGKTKEGIILDFYRQMIRNYTEWGFNLPDGLEAELALNSSFKDTFLQEGYMFQNVRIEANNARGKRIERYFGSLRYEVEKEREGWLARPHARSESNQISNEKIPMIPYENIVAGCVQDIFDWNNSPHSQDPSKTRWEYFQENQHPNLKPTNWKAILPHLGFRQPSSCNTGYVKLQGKARAIAMNGKICTGEDLIHAMKLIEGKEVEIFWLDDNQGNVLKAFAYYEGRFICELMEMPKYNRAVIERTPEQEEARTLQSSYQNTVLSFIRNQEKQLQNINIIKQPKPQPKNGFYIPGMDIKRFQPQTAPVEIVDQPDEDHYAPVTPNVSWQQSFFK